MLWASALEFTNEVNENPLNLGKTYIVLSVLLLVCGYRNENLFEIYLGSGREIQCNDIY